MQSHPRRSVILASTALLFAWHGRGAAQEPSRDAAPGVALQGSEAYKFRVGDVLVTALSDGTVPADLHKLLRGTSPEATDTALREGFLLNPVEVSINVYSFRLDGRLFLVDTGAGQLSGPGFGGRLLGNLAAIGIQPEQVTDILITHVHTDHTWGLVQHGRMVFPEATLHVGKPDLTFFLDGVGHVRVAGRGFQWVPVDFGDRDVK